jgi:hypothetical protein
VALTSKLGLVIDELVLDGVEPGDPVVHASISRALAPALEANGLAPATDQVATAVTAAVGREASA